MRVPAILRTMLVAVMALPLAGCLVVPVGMFTDNPYAKDKLAPLLGSDANRALVRQKFGDPAYTRDNQRYWFYTNQRAMVGVLAGTGSAVFSDNDWLLVEFDQAGKVVFAETRDFKQCTSNGICFNGAIYADPVKGPIHPVPPKDNECAVYLYLEKLAWPLVAGAVRYTINGKPVGMVDSNSYLFLTNPQGNIEISAYDLKITAKCAGGERLYIRAVKKADWSWKTGEDLAPIPQQEGEQKIRARHPALPD